MCKKHVLLLLLFALFAPWAAFGQTLTLYEDATETNEYVPFYGYYADATQQNQMIYPATELTDMQGKSITQMVFYIASKSGSYDIGNWIVSLGETESTTLSGLDETTPLTQVYSGAMTFNSDETLMTVTFTDGYTYGGKNLLVEFNHPVVGSYKHYFFTGEEVTGAAYTYGSARDFLPKVTFSYETPASCAKPTNLAAVLTPGNGTVATLSWTENGNATNWVLQTATDVDFTTGLEEYSVSTTPSKDLTGLTAETTYYARVKASCSASDQSDWSSVINFTPSNAFSITVNDGTSTNGYVPIYGYYVDGSIVSQFIMPAADLAAMQWGTINTMTFYASQASVNWGDAQFEVYMTEVDYTTFSSTALVDWSSMTKVMNAGSLSISGNQMEVILDAPYQYLGGNLLIGFKQTISGSYVTSSWYGVTATGASLGGDNTGSQQNFLPKTTFEFVPGEEPSCFTPTGLAVNYAGGLTAEVSWTSDATAWNIDVNGTVTAITENPYTLTGLDYSTTYEVKVQADCGNNGTSDWSNAVSFTTDCDIIPAVGYSENFDSYTAATGLLPDCWKRINTSTNGNYGAFPYITGSTGSANSDPNALRFYSYYSSWGSYDPQDQYAILPEMEGLAGTQVTLQVKGNNANSTFKMGTMTDPTDASTFTAFVTQDGLTTAYQKFEYIVPLDAAGNYLAIMIEAANSSRTNNGIYVDDIVIAEAPSCFKPTGLAAELTEGDGTIATLTWTDVSEASNWMLQYGTDAEFATGSYTEVTEGFTVEETTVTANLTGLTAETPYYARVKAVCSEDDQSEWCDVISFTPTNAISFTVCEGTSTNEYVPIYGYYVDNSIVSQFIIPADSLIDMRWGTINALTFYASNASIDWGAAKFEVYMTEVDYTTFSSNTMVNWASMTKVMNAGSLSISGNQMVVTFDEPYLYTSGNLLIGFKQTTSGSYVRSYWYGVTATGASLGGNNTGSQRNFLPKTTFGFIPNPDPELYEITVEANPEEGGTVTGGGEMLAGYTLTLTATADHFYEFVNWTKDGVVVDTVNPLTVTVTEDATYVANFNALPTFTVTVTANIEDAGEYGVIADTNIFLAGETCIVYAIPNEGYEFKSWVNAAGQLVSEEDMFEITVTNDTAFMAIFQMYPFELTATPDPIDIGERPSGAWMRPFPFTLTNGGVPDEVNSLTFDNDFFGIDLGDLSLPFTIGFQQTVNLGMTWGEGNGPITGHLTVGYGSEGETQQFDVAGTAYVPVEGDVWENPFVVSSFPYTSTVDATTMHDNYVLPLADIEDGNEVVYQLTFTEDTKLNASVAEGENGKVILYEEGFQGIGGPDEENFFISANRSGGNRDAMVLTVHDGTATNASVPVHGNWADAYLKCETLYPADELVEMVNGDISMITYYTSTPASGAWTGTFQVFLMEVDETTLTAYHDFSNATPFYEGQLDGTGSMMEIEFVTPYHYNGGNLLIAVYQTVSGNYKNVYWYGETVTGASIQGYNSSSLDAVTVGQRNFLPKTSFTYEPIPLIEPVIEDLTLMPGVYYLVASSTSDQYIVSIETEPLPCPEVAYEPIPADGAIEVSDVNVTLKWNLSDYTTSYTLLFGTDPEDLEPLVDWTRDLQTQYAIEDTLDLRTTYFWQVAEKNDGCPDGVYSDVWSFTTTFTSPNTLATLTGETEFAEGEEVQLVWEGAPEHRVEMIYEVYQDTVSIATTADTTFIIEQMPYGIHSYKVAARYTLDTMTYERFTNTLTIVGLRFGTVEGFVYEADGEQVISDATVTIYGIDDLGLYREYEFTTDVDGHYAGDMATGFYTGNYAEAEDYKMNSTPNVTSEVLGVYDFENQAYIFGAETGADYPWIITSDDNHTEDGLYSLRSNNKNAHSTTSYIGMYVTYPTDDTLSFAYRISSEQNWDKGYFSIDDVNQLNAISGEGSWETGSYPMTAGTHVIIWWYTKDSSGNSGDDCFYIDDIDFGTGVVEGILIENGATTSDVNFYLDDELYMVNNLYVSRTGYAMWEGLGEETGGTRHFTNAEVYLSTMDNDTIYVGSTTNNYMQLPTDLLEDGNAYWCHVSQAFTSGESQWYSTLFAYQSCDNFEGGAELEGILDATGVTLSWVYPAVDTTAVAPTTLEGTWYQYDNDTLSSSIGSLNGEYWWGIKLPNGLYEGNMINKVMAYDANTSTYSYSQGVVSIYLSRPGQDTVPTYLVGSTDFYLTGQYQWTEFAFDAPLTIPSGYDAWVVFHKTMGNGYPAAIATNTGDANGRWYSTDGTTWAIGDNAFMVGVLMEPAYNPSAVGNPIGAFLFRDGEWVDFVSADNYLDAEGEINTVYEMRVVYGGDTLCPNNNAYYTMSCLDTIPVRYAQYEISATVEPAEAGEVTGTGLLNYSSTAVLTAVAAEGYTFDHWTTAEGEEVEAGETLSFTVTEPASFVAVFTLNNYDIEAVANPEDGGTVEGAGNYDHFSTCTLIATPATGYHFLNWMLDNEAVSTADTLSFEVTGPATYVAVFEINAYEIVATADPEEGGSIFGAGTYEHFTIATLTAAPNTGYTFLNWTKDGEEVSTNETISDTVTGPATYVAHFELNSYEITAMANPEEGGTVEGAGTYYHFETVTLTATAAEGYTFEYWTKGGDEFATTETITDSVTGPAVYVAYFSLNSYEITAVADPEEGGEVEGAGTYDHFAPVTLTATAAEGYTFINWTKDGEEFGTTETITDTVTGPANYVANFSLNSYEITVVANPEEGGTVTGAGTYNHFETVTLTATAAEGYTFINWTSGNEVIGDTETVTITVTGEAEYLANFSLNSYEITAVADPEEGGEVEGAGTYDHFAEVTLTATAAEGYTFINWTKDGEDFGTTETITDTVTGPANYVANFSLNSYEITVVANPEEGGTVTGAGTYNHFETVTLTATAAEGYTFINWTSGNEVIGDTETVTITVTGEAEYLANFSLNSYEITAVANPEEGGTATGGGTYNHFDEATLTATAAEGYTFINWTMDGEVYAETEIITDTVTGPATYVANFELNSYDITVSVDPEDGGTITGATSGTYNHFDELTLSAQGAEGYTFLNWTKNGTQVSTSPEFIATVTGEAEYVAHFSHNAYVVTVDVNIEEAGTVTGTGGYDHGDIATLEATANEGYTFINWTMDGVEVSTDNPFELTVTESATYIANFELNNYEITVVADPEDGGEVEGAGTYDYGTEVTLTATAAEGYTFLNWTYGNEVITDNPYSFTVTEDAEYVAHFELNSYEITAVADPEEGGEVEGADTYDYGTEATLTATAAEGYTFLNWTYGNEVILENPYSFTVTEDAEFVAHFELNSYEITAVANPEVGGEVEGAGTYDYGTEVTLTATAAEGYTFLNWTYGNEVILENPYSFTVTEDAEFVANFELNSYEITAVANPEEGGTVEGAGTYNHGSICTLTATATEGYTFMNWTKDGELFAETETITDTVTGPAAYVANFELIILNVVATANPTDGGVVTGSDEYPYGTEVTLTATANEGYTFLNWTYGNEVILENPYSFTVTEDAEFVANFELNSYEITAVADPEDGGEVEGADTYDYGTEATLTATAAEGYTFLNWTYGNEVITDNPYSFTVTEDAEYVAHFELNSYEITAVADPEEGGEVEGADTYDYGTEATLTATAAEGYTFLNWTYGNEVITDNPYSFTVTEDAEFVAHFELNSYEITAVANPEVGGEVEGAGTYDYGTEVTLTATAAEGYTFLNWTYGNEVILENPYSFTVTEDAEFVANFELNSYEITAVANPEEGGEVEGAGTYNHGAICTLTATATEGYTFMNWTKDGELFAETETITDTVTGPAAYVANFELIILNVVATANPTDGGVVTGSDEYPYGTEVTLTATANEGYTFLNWTYGNEVILENPYSFTVTEDAEFVANFELNSYDIVAIAAPEIGGTADGTGTYYHFEEVTLTATAAEGYHFVNWTLNGEEVSTNETYVFEVTGPVAYAYVANFEINSYEITVVANPEEGGTVTGAGTYNHFDEVTLTATAAEGYTFINWTSGNEVIGDTETVTITVTGEAEYLANFELNSYEITATVNPANAGSITGAGTYYHFDEVTLTATAATGYTFINWTKDGEVFAETETITETVTGPAAYVANFELNSYEITVAANPEEGGEVEGAGTYNHFEEVTLTATAAEGYTFINWTKNGQTVSTNATYTFTATGGGEYVANFELNSYEITATVNPANTGTVTGAGTYNHFDEVTLTATAAMGYTFINWTMGNEVVSDSTSITFEVTGPADYVANFELSVYEITAVAEPEEGGTVTGAGSYTYMSTCMLTATANTGYTFLNWTLDGQVVSNTETFFIQVTEPADYVANFEINSFEITAVADPEDGGEVEGADTYDYGTEATLTATAAEGYTFLNWTYGNEVITDNPYSFTVTEAADFVAHFELNSYEITAVANPEDGGTVTGAGTYNHFDEVTLTATAATGYTFINWTMGNEVVSDSTSITVVVTGPADYIANFELSNITQVTDLAAGWNWWSSYVDLEENGLSLLEESIDPNGLVIKSQSNGFVNYAPGVGWYGSLANVGISNDLSYQIRMNQAAVSELSGLAVNPADHPITVYTGWTWIGYPSTNSMSVANAFNGVNPQTGDMVKSQNNGFASYLEGYGWYGALNTIEPGMGLMFKSTNTQAVTFTYGAERGELMANQKADNNHWVPNLHAYPDNMNVMAVIELNDEELRGENFELAAFANGECRGSARLLYVAPIDRYIAFLTVAGESEAELYFGLYDAETGLELLDAAETLDFTVNAVVGSFDEPFVVHFRNTTGTDEDILSMQVYPNPTQTGRTYSLGTLNNNLSNIRIEVINALGAVVAVEETTELPSSFKAPATPGVYTLRITVDGKGTICRKLVVR